MSTSAYCLDPSLVQDFANKDINRIVGKIAEVLARKSPYIDILEGGTLPNVSDQVRSVVQERASLGSSLAAPVFTNDVAMCGGPVGQDNVGSTEYTYQLQTYRGQGPLVCVKTSRTAFKGSYMQAQISLEKGILEIINADTRYQLYKQSGLKVVCNSTLGTNVLTGDMQAINTLFAPALPDSPLSFNLLYQLGVFLKEEMLAEPFTQNGEEFFKFIGSANTINLLRNELDIRADLRSLTTGQYKLGEKSITGYTWYGPYRGVAFGIDPQPLRFNTLDGSGQPVLIEPTISVPVTRGVAQRRNPEWVNALYEVGFFMAPESFRRLTPEQYTGEGTFKFAPQLYMGELEWFYIKDTCNKFGDYGQHIYQIQRAIQPIRPQNVIPIAYKRCPLALGIAPCSTSGSSQIGF